MSDERESRRALRELIALLEEIDERYLGEEWSAPAFGDLYDGYRSIAHTLEGALALQFENDASRPFFRAIGTRTRKMLGDNPDALVTDQRGFARTSGAAIDIGAYELQPDLIFADGFDSP